LDESKKTEIETDLRENNELARQILLASAPVTNRTIVRIVVITILIILTFLFFGVILHLLSFLLFLLVLSIFFAYLLEPLVKAIRRPFKIRNLDRFMPRPLAIVVSYLIVFSVLAVTISYLAPIISDQIREFAANLPNYANLVQERIAAINSRYEQLMITKDLQEQINKNIGSFVEVATVALTAFLGIVAVSVATYLPWILLIPVLAFFFLKDASLFRTMFLDCFPPGRWRARTESILNDVNRTLAAYTRAQLISCVLIGMICTLAFTIIGLDYAILLGILAGIFEFIPLLGPLTIGIIATLVAVFSDNPWQALWTASFLIILRLTHDYVTYPRIMRDGVHLHPFAVILSVLAGEQIAGIAGVFLSIPIVAIATVLHKNIITHGDKKGIIAGIFNSKTITLKDTEKEETPIIIEP
jgi:predicted PurR-regulated permease PerM